MIFDKNDNGTQEVSLIATWTSDHDYLHISKALLLSKRKVLKITGKEIYNVALTHYLSDDYQHENPTEEQKKLDQLVFWFQTVFLNFAYSKNMYKDTVLWNNSGINVVWSDEMRPATQETLNNLSESFDRDGYEFLDLLLEFLADNDFSEFDDSVELKRLNELFIKDAEEFSYYFNINNSVSYFFEIADVIRKMQRTHIANATSFLYPELKVYQQNRIDIDESTIIVETIEDLPAGESENTIVLVSSENVFYIQKTEWEKLCYDVRSLMELVKPAVVDLTIHSKFLSDISNLKTTKKQLEILRENINHLKESADTQISQIVFYVQELQEAQEDMQAIEIVSPVLGYESKNTFVM